MLHHRHTAIPGKAVLWLFLWISQTSETDTIQVLGYLDAVLNGVTKVRTMAYSNAGNEYHKAGPNLAVLPLQKEDRVWVRHYSCQGHYSGGPKTTFFQISPLIQSLNNMRWGKELSHRILEFLIKWSYMCVELI